MADLKIPNLNKNSDKYLFKNKLSLRRKSKKKLLIETFVMFCLSFLIIYLNYLIPNKRIIFYNFFDNIETLLEKLLETLYYFYEICLSIFIVLSLTLAVILIFGGISRMLKIVKRKTRQITFK